MKEASIKTIVLLIGLPAAGKTTFAASFCQYLNSEDMQYESVEYDKIEAHILDSQEFSPEKWKQSRVVVLQKTSQFLKNPLISILILDDNFYYRSMRKPFYQLCRENKANYIEVQFQQKLELLLQRNATRKHSVKPEIILKMQQKFQSTEHPAHHYNYKEDEKFSLFSSLKNSIHSTSQVPQEVEIVSQQEKEKQRLINRESALHQLDLELRKLVGETMRKSAAIKSKGKQLADIKRQLLNKARSEFNFKEEEIKNYLDEFKQRAAEL